VDELTVGSRKSGVGSHESAKARLLEVYSLCGVKVVTTDWPATDNQVRLDVSPVAPGMYFLVLRNDAEVLAKKMVVISR
jgi:hypothetical protein